MVAYLETWRPGSHTRSTREDYIIKHDMKLVHKLRNLVDEGGGGVQDTLKTDYVIVECSLTEEDIRMP